MSLGLKPTWMVRLYVTLTSSLSYNCRLIPLHAYSQRGRRKKLYHISATCMQLQCRLHASGMHQGSFYTGKSKMKLSWNYGGTSIRACTISVLDTMTVRALFGHSVFKFNQEMNSCCQKVISIYSHIKLNSAYKIIFLKSKLSTLNSCE